MRLLNSLAMAQPSTFRIAVWMSCMSSEICRIASRGRGNFHYDIHEAVTIESKYRVRDRLSRGVGTARRA